MFGWFREKEKGRTPAERMTTLREADVYYLPITKCGSTYLKNVFHYIDNGYEHDGGSIHNARALTRAVRGSEDKIRQSGLAFTVLRDPVDRFVSLYFDKIYGEGTDYFADFRVKLADDIGLDLTPNLDAAGHRANCWKFIQWIEKNLAQKTDEPVNPHWRRQYARIRRVEALNLEYLTLDGLDWQLPLFLGDVVPDIRDAMAAVKNRNKATRPVLKEALLDNALIAKIESVYAWDKKTYLEAKGRWANDEAGEDADELRMISAGDLPFYYVATPKVGCTYLKNLLYILEHGEAYSDPSCIHGSGAGSKVDLDATALTDTINFYVVRDPVERFFSLYFDKVVGDGPQVFPWIAKRLADKREFDVKADSVDAHRINIGSLLSYLELRFNKSAASVLNPHWRPQSETAKRVAGFGLRALLLENLDAQLLEIAGDRVPNLQASMDMVPVRNVATRPFAAADILTPEIAARIEALYADDRKLYEQVKQEWADGAA